MHFEAQAKDRIALYVVINFAEVDLQFRQPVPSAKSTEGR